MSVLSWATAFASVASAWLVLGASSTPLLPLLVLIPVWLISLLFVAFPLSLLLALTATFPFGFPLMLLPTAAVYLTAALLPATLVRAAGFQRSLTFSVAGLGVFAVALGLPWYAEASTRRAASHMADTDRVEVGQSRPATIEFIDRAEFNGTRDHNPRDASRKAACDAVCQKLLLGREVEWVRVIAYRKVRPAVEEVAALRVYRLESPGSCPPVPSELNDELPETRRARHGGTCIIVGKPSVDSLPPAGARVERRFLHHLESMNGNAAASAIVTLSRVEVTVPTGDLERRRLGGSTDFLLRTLRVPFSIAFGGLFNSGFGPAVSKDWKIFRPVNVADLLRTTLGYRI